MINSRLPSCISVEQSASAHPDFDARKSVLWRRYRYSILNTSAPSVFLSSLAWHYYTPLDTHAMHTAAQYLLCETPRDLSAFRKARSSAAHTNICVYDIRVQKSVDGNLVEIEVCANWFVYGMMRLLTAALVEVGSGRMTQNTFELAVRNGRRDLIKTSAPPEGLCLLQVGYPPDLHPFRDPENSQIPYPMGLSPYIPDKVG